jgi:lysophospholipase L1-like esterase
MFTPAKTMKRQLREKLWGINPTHMQRVAFLTLILLAALSASQAQTTNKWETEILAFEASDHTNPPPKRAVLFVGSSSIRLWKTLAQDFPKHRVINRGFGGSEISDSVAYAKRIVLPYKPRMIVMYAGGNDIHNGKTPERVLNDFKTFVDTVHAALPGTKIVWISIAPNPARWSEVDRVRAANALVADFAHKHLRVEYIDVFSQMLGPDGQPLPDIYSSDRLHMNERGYSLWTRIVKRHL